MLRRRMRLKRKEYRFGKNAKCALCRESDLRTLDSLGKLTLCRRCRLLLKGKSTMEDHHIIGRSNDEYTVAISANEHAILSDYQNDWPKEIIMNTNRDYLYEVGALLLMLADYREFLSERVPLHAARLKEINEKLKEKYGDDWLNKLDEDEN